MQTVYISRAQDQHPLLYVDRRGDNNPLNNFVNKMRAHAASFFTMAPSLDHGQPRLGGLISRTGLTPAPSAGRSLQIFAPHNPE